MAKTGETTKQSGEGLTRREFLGFGIAAVVATLFGGALTGCDNNGPSGIETSSPDDIANKDNNVSGENYNTPEGRKAVLDAAEGRYRLFGAIDNYGVWHNLGEAFDGDGPGDVVMNHSELDKDILNRYNTYATTGGFPAFDIRGGKMYDVNDVGYGDFPGQEIPWSDGDPLVRIDDARNLFNWRGYGGDIMPFMEKDGNGCNVFRRHGRLEEFLYSIDNETGTITVYNEGYNSNAKGDNLVRTPVQIYKRICGIEKIDPTWLSTENDPENKSLLYTDFDYYDK
ncbi:hypothetical protein FACS189431_2420 [Alphaproteobacteria bacterium]|nr:hypothetical protein FACS189431_2420 [Alphaproteobacteria bacterium]